jgi:hypothetical protein
MVVMDESWRMFSHLAIASWMQQSFKLSRASGTMNVLVMHRLSDLASAGAAGSHQVVTALSRFWGDPAPLNAWRRRWR